MSSDTDIQCCEPFPCRILNKLTPEKFDLLKGQLIDSGITSADILKVHFIFCLKYFSITSLFLIDFVGNAGSYITDI